MIFPKPYLRDIPRKILKSGQRKNLLIPTLYVLAPVEGFGLRPSLFFALRSDMIDADVATLIKYYIVEKT